MNAVLVTAPCPWQGNAPEPCGEPSTYHLYAGTPEHATFGNRTFWKPLCKRHTDIQLGAAYCFPVGTVHTVVMERMA